MLYILAYAQGILDMVNMESTTYELSPPTTIVTTLVSYLAPIVEMPTPASKVDQLTDFADTLLLGEPTPPLVSENRF